MKSNEVPRTEAGLKRLLTKWLNERGFHGQGIPNWVRVVFRRKRSAPKPKAHSAVVRFELYTHRGIITVGARADKEGTYLGGGWESRSVDPGEDWRRGADLADGKVDPKVLDEILFDALRMEIVPPASVTRPVKKRGH
jgi:hypothetical protein